MAPTLHAQRTKEKRREFTSPRAATRRNAVSHGIGRQSVIYFLGRSRSVQAHLEIAVKHWSPVRPVNHFPVVVELISEIQCHQLALPWKLRVDSSGYFPNATRQRLSEQLDVVVRLQRGDIPSELTPGEEFQILVTLSDIESLGSYNVEVVVDSDVSLGPANVISAESTRRQLYLSFYRVLFGEVSNRLGRAIVHGGKGIRCMAAC